MGPAYFPRLVAGILALVGLKIIFDAFRGESSPFGRVSWRGAILVLAAPVAFGLTIQGLGLIGSTILLCLLSAYASRQTSILTGVLCAIVLTAICYGVFKVGLNIPMQTFGSWFNPD
jgi:hypothetical protein